ncbi:hypothetical protein EDB89DRAFT_1906365 [Lactarius sanguifluus]|nr:hypothetical protein EDB89DRAFT_1906365 [Lactarius sanguifluus]
MHSNAIDGIHNTRGAGGIGGVVGIMGLDASGIGSLRGAMGVLRDIGCGIGHEHWYERRAMSGDRCLALHLALEALCELRTSQFFDCVGPISKSRTFRVILVLRRTYEGDLWINHTSVLYWGQSHNMEGADGFGVVGVAMAASVVRLGHGWGGVVGVAQGRVAWLGWHGWGGMVGVAWLGWHGWGGMVGVAWLGWCGWGSAGLIEWHSWGGAAASGGRGGVVEARKARLGRRH